jgi:hypothetical protein
MDPRVSRSPSTHVDALIWMLFDVYPALSVLMLTVLGSPAFSPSGDRECHPSATQLDREYRELSRVNGRFPRAGKACSLWRRD